MRLHRQKNLSGRSTMPSIETRNLLLAAWRCASNPNQYKCRRVSRFATPFLKYLAFFGIHCKFLSLSMKKFCYPGFQPGATRGRGRCTEFRTVCTEDAWPVICEEMPGCRETRHPGIFTMCFYPVIPIIHFPGPAFPLCVYKARFHDVKQDTCHGLQQLCSICRGKTQSFRISPRSWPRWRKNANVINCYHSVTS